MRSKTFKSIDEQVEILKGKGLIIDNIDYAKTILLRENYFFINGYRHVFMNYGKVKTFKKNVKFEELYSLFQFDRRFRNIIFKNILIFENNYKSIFSYVLSKNYGFKEKDYLNLDNFNSNRLKQVNDLIRKLKRQIAVNGRQHEATRHYINNYGFIPLWVGVKVLSFGIVSELFSVLKEKDQEEISSLYDISDENLEIYLPILANYRNLCAHEDILFNHRTQRRINNTKYHDLLRIKKIDDEYIYGKCDIFALIIILKCLLTKDDFKMMMNEIIYEIDILKEKIKSVDIDAVLEEMGFPTNYEEIMYI